MTRREWEKLGSPSGLSSDAPEWMKVKCGNCGCHRCRHYANKKVIYWGNVEKDDDIGTGPCTCNRCDEFDDFTNEIMKVRSKILNIIDED